MRETPTAAERARERLLWAWLAANPNQPMREGMDEVRRMLDDLRAERPPADPLREALTAVEWADVVDVYGSFGSRVVSDRLEHALASPAAPRPDDLGSERGRLLAWRDRLVAEGVDPADLVAIQEAAEPSPTLPSGRLRGWRGGNQ